MYSRLLRIARQIGQIVAYLAIFYIGQFLEDYKNNRNFLGTFSAKKWRIIFLMGFGQLIHKLIWSPCYQRSAFEAEEA
jgi:hypothetical protein